MPSTENKNNESKAESRRDFLKTAGKFAVYTPPALMLMTSGKHGNAEEMCKSLEWCGDSQTPM
jgi:hypothetical protein